MNGYVYILVEFEIGSKARTGNYKVGMFAATSGKAQQRADQRRLELQPGNSRSLRMLSVIEYASPEYAKQVEEECKLKFLRNRIVRHAPDGRKTGEWYRFGRFELLGLERWLKSCQGTHFKQLQKRERMNRPPEDLINYDAQEDSDGRSD